MSIIKIEKLKELYRVIIGRLSLNIQNLKPKTYTKNIC